MQEKLQALQNLLQTIDRLQAPGGCPWDREQTVSSLAQYVLEEAYEVVDAIHSEQREKIIEEVGDLLQVLVMLCAIAEREKQFSVADSARAVSEKLVRRHPHVFGDVKVSGSAEVLQNWEQLKQKEKSKGESALSGVPQALPALLRAYRVGEKAARLGFKWPDLNGPLDKVAEEFAEFRAEVEKQAANDEGHAHMEREYGDLIYSMVALGRHLKLNPEIALRKTIDRFIARFNYIERKLDKPMKDASLPEMEALWEKAKTELES